MSQARILIADDDDEIRQLIVLYLRNHDFLPVEACNGVEAIKRFHAMQPDLVLLDVLMPQMDGFEVCKIIRQVSMVPIVFLTGKWEAEDVVNGLDLGGDDYVTKPFVPEVLIAGVRSNLRRVRKDRASKEILSFGDLLMNRHTYEVYYQGKRIPLLAKEIKLLLYFAERPRRVFSAEQLYEHVWDFAEGDARTVMVHISKIRQKLHTYAPNTVKIETIKGAGYRFVLSEDP